MVSISRSRDLEVHDPIAASRRNIYVIAYDSSSDTSDSSSALRVDGDGVGTRSGHGSYSA